MNSAIRFRYRDLIDQLDSVRLYRLHIEGVEVTQAIQHYRSEDHLTDSADRAPDNSVRLIAGKPACVCVYVRSEATVPPIFGVTGELEVLRGGPGMPYSTVAKLRPRNGPIVGYFPTTEPNPELRIRFQIRRTIKSGVLSESVYRVPIS